jgi:ATP-dependent helicase HrpA
MSELRPLQTQWLRSLAASHSSRGAGSGIDPQLEQFGWMLEELRVQLFAQTLRTPVPVSAKRLQKLWESLQR